MTMMRLKTSTVKHRSYLILVLALSAIAEIALFKSSFKTFRSYGGGTPELGEPWRPADHRVEAICFALPLQVSPDSVQLVSALLPEGWCPFAGSKFGQVCFSEQIGVNQRLWWISGDRRPIAFDGRSQRNPELSEHPIHGRYHCQ